MIRSTKTLKNNEGLDIELTDYYGYSLVTITVNGFDYAQFQEAYIEDINLRALAYWIEETYYSGDYMSEGYTPCDLNIQEFNK